MVIDAPVKKIEASKIKASSGKWKEVKMEKYVPLKLQNKKVVKM